MKRLGLLVFLVSLGLTSCTITGSVSVKKIEVTASENTVAPGAEVTLTADPNFETSSRILWDTGGGDDRATEVAFSDDGVGRTVTYFAPENEGTYTVRARTADELSVSGSTKITVDAFLGATRVNAGTDSDVTLATGSLAPGAEKLLVVQVSSDVADAGDALYFELETNINLTVLDEDRTVYATSSSAAFFAAGTAGLSSVGLDAQTITPAGKGCDGSCVIRDAAAGTYYLRLENSNAATVNYTLHAYVTDYADGNEPNNDSEANAVTLGAFDTAAIESLGDQDYYVAGMNGKLCFVNTSWADARVNITAEDLNETLLPGEQFLRLQAGDVIRVYEDGGDRAASVDVSKYSLEILPSSESCS